MNTHDIARSLSTVLREIVEGASTAGGYLLNGGDEGLLRSLDKLSGAAASAPTPTGSSIAAHAAHVRYGLSLMNRWAQGEENPFDGADWSASWRKTSVSEGEWQQVRAELRSEATRWLTNVGHAREVDEVELNGMLGSIAHMAYHLGAIRQINQLAKGPRDGQTQD